MNVFFTATFVCFCWFTAVAESAEHEECLKQCPALAEFAEAMDASDPAGDPSDPAGDPSNPALDPSNQSNQSMRRLAAKLQEELAAVVGGHRRLNDNPLAMSEAMCTDSIIAGIECMKTEEKCTAGVEEFSQSEETAVLLGLPCLCETCPLKDAMAEMSAIMTPEDGGGEVDFTGVIVAGLNMMCKMAEVAECMEAENEKQAGSCPTAMIEGMTGNGSATCMCSICPGVETLTEILSTADPNATDEEIFASMCKVLSVDGCFEKANAEEAGLCPSGGLMSVLGGPGGGEGGNETATELMKTQCEEKGLLTDIEPELPAELVSVGLRSHAPPTILAAAAWVAMGWCGGAA